MSERLRIGVVGAGSVGCYVGGKIVAANAADVVFVGRARLKDEIAANGLTVKDLDQDGVRIPAAQIAFATEVDALKRCSVVLCCVKSAQTAGIARDLGNVLPADAIVVSLQNGVRNPEVLRAGLGGRRVIPAIVSFNVVSRGNGLFHRGTTGPLMFESIEESRFQDLVRTLIAAGLDVEVRRDLAPDQWTKLLVNLNNAVSALSGAPTRQLILSREYRRVIASLIDEALQVLRAAHLRPASLRGVPVALMPFILRLPTPLTRLVLRAQMRIDPESRSSMWEDLMRNRATEVDFLNGEIVRFGESVGVDAALNRRIVELVHEAESRGHGSPGMAASELWSRISTSKPSTRG